jgi:hypothetical protein
MGAGGNTLEVFRDLSIYGTAEQFTALADEVERSLDRERRRRGTRPGVAG